MFHAKERCFGTFQDPLGNKVQNHLRYCPVHLEEQKLYSSNHAMMATTLVECFILYCTCWPGILLK